MPAQIVIMAIGALGMTLVIVGSGIDLSVGSTNRRLDRVRREAGGREVAVDPAVALGPPDQADEAGLLQRAAPDARPSGGAATVFFSVGGIISEPSS